MRIRSRVASLEPLIRALVARRHRHRPRRHGRAEVASHHRHRRPAERAKLRRSGASAGEINQGAADEGAGWDAAVEEAPGATPLIGEQQDAAVQRINDYFNNLNSIQGNFEQVDSNNKHTNGRFYVQRPGKLRFDYAPPSTLRLVADGHFLAIEDSSLKTVEKYPHRVDAVPPVARRRRRSRPRFTHRRRRGR